MKKAHPIKSEFPKSTQHLESYDPLKQTKTTKICDIMVRSNDVGALTFQVFKGNKTSIVMSKEQLVRYIESL